MLIYILRSNTFFFHFEFDLKSINQEFINIITKQTFHSIFYNRNINYDFKSVIFVNLGLNMQSRKFFIRRNNNSLPKVI